ncbi:MAG: hypothetical protein HRT47_03365 [Candidatus Caenarcaniphilales bacterium]|nr:hypothetical protein [Candidatus Caenarcaniphilales bacterium]
MLVSTILSYNSNLSKNTIEALQEKKRVLEEGTEINSISEAGKKLLERGFLEKMAKLTWQTFNVDESNLITKKDIADSSMNLDTVLKKIKSRHPQENFFLLVGEAHQANVRPTLTKKDFQTLKDNGVGCLMLEVAHNTDTISGRQELSKSPNITFNEFLDEVYEKLEHKYSKQKIIGFMKKGQDNTLKSKHNVELKDSTPFKPIVSQSDIEKIEPETNTAQSDNSEKIYSSYLDVFEEYKRNAEDVGIEVKFIDVSTDDGLKANLTLELLTGLLEHQKQQTPKIQIFNYNNRESDDSNDNLNFAIEKTSEYLSYQRHGIADKFMAEKAKEHMKDLNTNCVFIGGQHHTNYMSFNSEDYSDNKSLGLRLSADKIPTYSFEVIREEKPGESYEEQIKEILSDSDPVKTFYPCRNLNSSKAELLGSCVNEYPDNPNDNRPVGQFRDGIIYLSKP